MVSDLNARWIPESIPEVEVLRRKPGTVEPPTVVTSGLVTEPYAEDNVVDSLLKETRGIQIGLEFSVA